MYHVACLTLIDCYYQDYILKKLKEFNFMIIIKNIKCGMKLIFINFFKEAMVAYKILRFVKCNYLEKCM